MSDNVALGVHDHPSMKLGLKVPDPSLPALCLGDFLTGTIPVHPANADYLQNIQFGMYANDRFGVCGPTSVCNSRREITARLTGQMVAPSQDDCFDLYRRSGNPNFDPNTGQDDNGVNMQVMLQAVLRGGIGGVKCLGFARVNTRSLDELQAAVAIFGFLLFGVNLQTAQQSQTNQGVWDYRPSSQWGGHAILGGAYVSSDLEVITWAERVKMTSRFIQHQLSEAWAVIWPEHLTDKGFLQGVDLNAFAKAWQDITGKQFPADIPPPSPKPTPTPTPTGSGVLTIDPVAKKIVYPAGWTAVQTAPSKDDFRIV